MTTTVTKLVGGVPKVFKSFRELHGVVVSSGLMQRTVKVKVGGMKWNNFLKKFFDNSKTFLVNDPNDSLRTGDVVAITPGERNSKHKRHVVKHIIAPAGTPIEERAPIPTEEERWSTLAARAEAKLQRKSLRQRAEQAQAELERTTKLVRTTQKQISAYMRIQAPLKTPVD